MTPERQADIRSALEQDDPERYWAMGGYTVKTARGDYDVKWELLLALEKAQERIVLLETALESMCSVFHRAAWHTDERAAMKKAREALIKS